MAEATISASSDQGVFATFPDEAVRSRGDEPCPSRAEGMTDSEGAAAQVQLVKVDVAELAAETGSIIELS